MSCATSRESKCQIIASLKLACGGVTVWVWNNHTDCSWHGQRVKKQLGGVERGCTAEKQEICGKKER
jgi:hypothetical protein